MRRPSQMTEAVVKQLLQGRSNREILSYLVEHHGVDPVKRRYLVSWHRARLVREGLLSKSEAERTRHK